MTPTVFATHMWAKWLHNPCSLGGPQCGEKIRSGHTTPTVLGAYMWAKWLHDPCHLRPPPKGGKSKWLQNMCHLSISIGELRQKKVHAAYSTKKKTGALRLTQLPPPPPHTLRMRPHFSSPAPTLSTSHSASESDRVMH